MISQFRKLFKEERGQAIVMMSIGIAVFLGFAAISVDYGHLAWQKRELQNAADAGALAAAWELPKGDYTTKAREYANEHIEDSFKSASLVNNGRGVRVEVEKEYERMFGRIFSFFSTDAANSDMITAEAVAAKELTQLDLLPFADIDTYKDPNIKDNKRTPENDPFHYHMLTLTIDEYYDFLVDRWEENEYTYEYFDGEEYVEETITLNDEIGFREDTGNVSGNLGLLSLEDFSEGNNIKEVLRYRLEDEIYDDTSCTGTDIEVKTGKVDAIEKSSEKDLSTRLEEDGWRGYVLAVLPSKSIELTGSSLDIHWGEYLVLYIEEFEVNINNSNKPIWGYIRGVWNVSACEFPDMLDEVNDQRVMLIK